MGTPTQNQKPGSPTSKVDLVLLCLVLALGLFSARAFFLRQQTSPVPAPLASADRPGRGPASVGSAADQVKERSTKVLDLGCLDEKTTRVRTEAGLLRLIADSCAGSIATMARNETTGES